MIRVRFALVAAALLVSSSASAQILFQYEDLDPDGSSAVNNGLIITGATDGTRTFGNVDVGSVAGTFSSLTTSPAEIDISTFIGKQYAGFAEAFIPSGTTLNTGDSIFYQVDFYSSTSAIPYDPSDVNTFQRSTAGFFNDTSPQNEWLAMDFGGVIPDLTPNGDGIDRAAATVVFTDGGFGGVPQDSSSPFASIDNFSFTISEPAPPSPIFYQNDAPDDTMDVFGVLIEGVADPLDPGNDVGLISLGGAGTFVNVNGGPAANSAPFAGEKFRAAFDYLVPSNTALEDGDDTFWVQLGFFDPVSDTVFGGNNSDSAGFPGIAAVADDTWRTIEVIGTVPTDTQGAAISIVISDDGFGGGPADTFGDAFYIDNIIFEAIDRLEGDYNGDGVVDALDYVAYRDNLGAAPPTAPYDYRDATNLDGEEAINHNGDGMNGVTVADHAVFAGNYGAAAPSSSAAIPEPGAGLILLSGVAAASWRRVGVARRCEADRRRS